MFFKFGVSFIHTFLGLWHVITETIYFISYLKRMKDYTLVITVINKKYSNVQVTNKHWQTYKLPKLIISYLIKICWARYSNISRKITYRDTQSVLCQFPLEQETESVGSQPSVWRCHLVGWKLCLTTDRNITANCMCTKCQMWKEHG